MSRRSYEEGKSRSDKRHDYDLRMRCWIDKKRVEFISNTGSDIDGLDEMQLYNGSLYSRDGEFDENRDEIGGLYAYKDILEPAIGRPTKSDLDSIPTNEIEKFEYASQIWTRIYMAQNNLPIVLPFEEQLIGSLNCKPLSYRRKYGEIVLK
jgi:hypothetical protein